MVVRLGIDGPVDVQYPEDSGCCPMDICNISPEQLACTFVNLLPSGPLWDRAKSEYMQTGDTSRTSIVNVAVFLANVFNDILKNALWPSIREAYPWTAATTLQDWLVKLNWVDCFGACRNRDLTALSPLEVLGVCGPIYCGPEFSEEYQRAYDYAILQSIHRMLLRPLQTLDSLNSILEPLGIAAEPGDYRVPIDPDTKCAFDANGKICITLRVVNQEIFVPKVNCGEGDKYIPAYAEFGCDRPAGIPEIVWPTALAAECITRAFLPRNKLCVVNLNCAEPELEG